MQLGKLNKALGPSPEPGCSLPQRQLQSQSTALRRGSESGITAPGTSVDMLGPAESSNRPGPRHSHSVGPREEDHA